MAMFFSNQVTDATSRTVPTLFELSMASSLSASLQPGFDYALGVLAEQGHRWAAHAYRGRNEAFAVLMLLVERHHLQQYDGAFAENFYGLKRTRPDGSPLAPALKLASLVELAVVPYALKTLAARFAARESRRGAAAGSARAAAAPEPPSLWSLYRPALAAYELAVLAFQVSFLFGGSPYYTPLLRAQRVVVARLTADDVQRHREVAAKAAASWARAASVRERAAWLLGQLQRALHLTFVASAVIFKMAEFYTSPENRAAREAQQRKLATSIPPPRPPVPTPGGQALVGGPDPTRCPLCGNVRSNPALSSSGFCFCYACISDYVAKHGACPVAGTPCDASQIRRVFAT